MGKRAGRGTLQPAEIAGRGVILALLTLALSFPGAATAAPSASEPQLAPVKAEKTVKAGSRATFTVAIGPTASCSARLTGSRRQLSISGFDQIEIVVNTPARTKPGSYRIWVTCLGIKPLRLILAVQNSSRPHPLNKIGRNLQIIGTHVRPPTAEEAAAAAHRYWLQQGPAILAGWRSGQCTDWAAQKRPDVVQRVEEATFAADLLNLAAPTPLGNAQTWATSAASAGMTVSAWPIAGALVVWQEGIEGASLGTGHVGYVESLAADGSTFSTSEMNVGEPYRMGYRTLSSVPVDGRQFIWP